MKVINPHGLKFALLVGRVPPRPLSATFVVKAGFKLEPNGVARLLAEAEQPEFSGDQYYEDDPGLGLRYPTDFALFKPGADVLLSGHCHAPGGRAVAESDVVFGVGGGAKRLLVFGDRVWQQGPLGVSISAPRPFTRMPLTWARAFGGPGDGSNPAGRGIADTPLEDGSAAPLLPNIEWPRQPIAFQHDRPAPAGFGPVAQEWTLRAAKTGTYDSNWLMRRWPWFPDDFDWTFFNAAPPDQQLQGRYLRGDEALRFVNMHPQSASYECTLSGDRARLFVQQRVDQALVFREVELRLDTLFADLDAETVTLIWRGVATAHSLKLKEFEEAFVVLEPLASPLAADAAGYAALYARRKAEIAAAEAGDFKPIGPIVVLPPREPDTSWADRMQRDADAEAQAAEVPDIPSADVEWRKAFGTPMPTEAPPPAGAIPASLAEIDALINQELDKIAAHEPGTAKPFLAHRPNFAALQRELDEDEKSRLPPLDPPESDEGDDQEWTRERVAAHAAAGGGFDGQDLARLDLSKLDFSSLSFREAVLEGAVLDEATFDGCDLTDASVIDASLARATFRASQLENADFSNAQASGSIWQRANLTCTEFSNAQLPGADFRECRGKHASFEGCDLAGASFEHGRLQQPDFTRATLVGASFIAAECPDADFDGCVASGASFEGAQMPRGRFSNAQATSCNFTGCVLNDAALDNSRIGNSNFTRARLREAIFTAARAPGALFLLADCVNAKFDDVVAPDVRFVQTNLFRASFENADLTKAIFLGSNCYEVEFFQAVLEGATFEQTNLKGTKLA